MLKVVLDVNVLVSSLINRRGPPGRIQAAWRRGELMVVTSQVIINKTGKVLHRPHILTVFSITETDIHDLLHALSEHGLLTPHLLDLQVVKEDPEDDTIITAAVEGKADCIISGDKHLTKMESYQDIPILSPAEFVTQHEIP